MFYKIFNSCFPTLLLLFDNEPFDFENQGTAVEKH